MESTLKSKLKELLTDFTKIGNPPFKYFYCPILFKDKDVELCKGHIVNSAFKESSRKWTIQRKDVDNFFGSKFEADFNLLQVNENFSMSDKLMDKRFRPIILADETPVEYYVTKADIPLHFTPIEFTEEGKTIHIGLKMNPEEFLKSQKKQWAIDVLKDIRIASLVSLIKSAYLTLFELLGYSYVLSAAGVFVGKNILGEFYLQNYKYPKKIVIQNALIHFKKYVHMVRPVQTSGFNFQGTISDKMLLVCRGTSGSPWGIIVFIRTGSILHSVMMPVFDKIDMISTYDNFLKNKNETITVSLCRYDEMKNIWQGNQENTSLNWPKKGVLFP